MNDNMMKFPIYEEIKEEEDRESPLGLGNSAYHKIMRRKQPKMDQI